MSEKKKKKRAIQLIMGVSIAGFVICAGIIIAYCISLQKNQNRYQELSEEYRMEENEAQEVSAQDTSLQEEEVYVSPIDFAKIRERENPDVCGWIKIDGTIIDYPVLQHPEDDTYYLTHCIDGTYGYPGCIYAELYNTPTFEDPVTVLYGHYMKDGSMFTDLHKFMDRSFFDEHREIIIYTPEKEHHYEIFAAVHTDDKRILVWNNFEDKNTVEFYFSQIQGMEENSTDHIKEEIALSGEDNYLILQTCVDESADIRYAVMGVEKK